MTIIINPIPLWGEHTPKQMFSNKPTGEDVRLSMADFTNQRLHEILSEIDYAFTYEKFELLQRRLTNIYAIINDKLSSEETKIAEHYRKQTELKTNEYILTINKNENIRRIFGDRPVQQNEESQKRTALKEVLVAYTFFIYQILSSHGILTMKSQDPSSAVMR